MNCRTAQNQLLILEDPGQPSTEVQDHLQACAPCRQWQQQLLQMERSIPLLPVPSTRNQEEMVRQFLAGESQPANGTPNGTPFGQRVPPPILSLENTGVRLGKLIPRYRLYAALAVAAALFLLIFDGLMLWQPNLTRIKPKKGTSQDPFLASLLDRNLRLAKAATPRKRLAALVDLADDLQGQTRRLIRRAEVEDLQELAHLFEQVVEEGIVRGANNLPAEQRPQVLETAADRLTRAGRDADRLAQEVPGDSANALRVIASAAQHGGDQLRALMRE